jgi:hypothetical protein
VATPVVLAQARGRDGQIPTEAASPLASLSQATSWEECAAPTLELLRADLVQTAAGKPDVSGSDVTASVAQELGGSGTATFARAERVHDAIVGGATGDLINRYHGDVAVVLDAYAPTVEILCLST